MRAIAGSFLLIASVGAIADCIVLHHVRPSKVLTVLRGRTVPGMWNPEPSTFGQVPAQQGLIPNGVTEILADDDAKCIVVEGSTNAIEETKRLLAEFDVAPRKVAIKVLVQSPADSYESTTRSEASNNAEWSLRDGTCGLDLTMATRINGDGTLTGTFRVGSAKSPPLVTMHRPSGEATRLLIRGGVLLAVFAKGSWWAIEEGDANSGKQLQPRKAGRTVVDQKASDVIVTVTLDNE